MTSRLDHAVAAVRRLPPERQDELADLLEAAAAAPDRHSDAGLAAIDEGLADADAGRFASESEVANFFARYRRGRDSA